MVSVPLTLGQPDASRDVALEGAGRGAPWGWDATGHDCEYRDDRLKPICPVPTMAASALPAGFA
jgi:hypothetical protein